MVEEKISLINKFITENTAILKKAYPYISILHLGLNV